MYSLTEFRAHTKQAFDRAIISPVKVLRDEKVFYLLSEKQYKQLQVDFVRNMMQNPSQGTKTQPTAPVKPETQLNDKFYDVFHKPSGERMLKRVSSEEADNYLSKYNIDGDLDTVEVK